MLIEENTFYNPSSGIWVAGDANYWFESGPVHELVIRNNRFLECGYADGAPAITIAPEIPAPAAGAPCYHRNITIEGNEFRTRGGRILQARSVEGLTVRGNLHERIGVPGLADTREPGGGLGVEPLQLEGCPNAEVQKF
jgi:hypothetical protein